MNPYPAHIRDNPVLQGAFVSFVNWLWRQEWAHEQFCSDTGTLPLTPARNGLDRMIDSASGREAAYAEAFVPWAIINHWGAESEHPAKAGEV